MIELSEQQISLLKETCKSVNDLNQLTKIVFSDDSLDGRSKQGRAVRKFLIESELDFKTSQYEKLEDIILTEEEKEFLDQYAGQNMTSMQLAQVLWPDREIKKLSKEQRIIADYIRDNFSNVTIEDDAVGLKYSPPKAKSRVIKKINDFCGSQINDEKMTMQDKKCIESLMNFLSSPRFLQVINGYENSDDRRLFEAEFVRSIWDKPDLTNDEINLYINVCMDYINLKHIEIQKHKLNSLFNEAEGQQEFTIRLTEILKTKSEEYNQCASRMDKLITKLNGDRSKRIANREQQNASVLNIVQLFQEEEERNIMVQMAEMQKKMVGQEKERLESMSDWKARVLGVGQEDVI